MLKYILGLPLALILLAAVGLWLNWQLQTPSHDRDWDPVYSRLATVEQTGQSVTIGNVRDWDYGPDRATTPSWIEVAIDPNALVDVYFVVEPFGSMKAVAHTMLAFEFADGAGYIASVEARREKDEAYGGLRAGVLPMHEYMFVWTTERDMYANSTFYTGDDLHVYRLELSPQAKRAVLLAMLEETASLEETPAFYNTFFSNCTNVLARAVNKVSPGAVPWDSSWYLPGYAAEYLHELGMISAPEGFEALRARSHITPHVEDLYAIEDPVEFAIALRARIGNK